MGYIALVCLLLVIDSSQCLVFTKEGWRLFKSSEERHIIKPVQSNLDYAVSSEMEAVCTYIDLKNKVHMQHTEISFSLKGQKFVLVLNLNKDLIPSKFSYTYFSKEGKEITKRVKGHHLNNCYYHGYVKGLKGTSVVVNTCNGLHGTIFMGKEMWEIAPIDSHNRMHLLYKSNDHFNHSCGTSHEKKFFDVMSLKDSHLRLKRNTDNEKKFIELLFVADKKNFDRFETREKLHDHVKSVINYIDSLYKKLGLRVVLLHVEDWENGDKIESDSNPQNVLNKFLDYRKDRLQNSSPNSPWRYTDNAQLLYGDDFDGSTVGMATVSSMCGIRSGGVNQDRGSALTIAATVSHEMGHNLGMSHDNKENCKCSGRNCVMAATASNPPPEDWSDCSVNYLHRGYKYGTAGCLLNVPDSSKLFGGPVCGNGIVEAGEKCDCGFPDECTSSCCNATTCQLFGHADCDEGVCCTSDCHYKSSCSVCRAEENDCDIAEYCTGGSPYCPGNIHKIDGMDCDGDVGICYGGVCRSHEKQCQEVWGPKARRGPEQCYISVNKKGDANGNCGKVGGLFVPCEKEHSSCGKLQCVGGEDYPLIGGDRVHYLNSFEGHTCKSVSSVGSTDVGDLGLVWDGTKCANGKMCFNGACINITSVLKQCSYDCSGRGVCNNFGNCHCQAGWGPPDCKRRGNGGSADSGPICVSDIDMQVVLLLVFVLVILPIILIIIGYIWYRYCGGKPKMYAWRKRRELRRRQSAKPRLGNSPPGQNSSDTNLVNEEKYRDHPAPNKPSPSRPPPPGRPSPLLPIRGAPPRPAPAMPNRPPPKPAAQPTTLSPPPVVYTPQPRNEENHATSIQDRIKRLQASNAV